MLIIPCAKTMDSTFEISCEQHSGKAESKITEASHKELKFDCIEAGPRRVILSKQYTEYAEKITNMEIRKDDVWLLSFPRSGSTWTAEMIWLLCNNLNYTAAKNNLLQKRVMFLEFSLLSFQNIKSEEFPSIDEIMIAESPRFIKSHLSLELLPKQLWTVKPKIIYVYRNPKDVVASIYDFQRLMFGYEGTFEETVEKFLQNKVVFNPFWRHVLDFWELQKKQQVLFLTYEEMKEDLLSTVFKVANYLETSLDSEQAKKLTEHLNFKNMKQNPAVNQEKRFILSKTVKKPEDVNFIRKGLSGQWKESMTRDMIARFDTWSKKYIDGTDFNFYE